VGVTVLNRRLRYLAVNEALASINGVPARAHLGHTLAEIIGEATETVKPVFDRVFETGESALNCEGRAYLPGRGSVRHWVKDVFPIHGKAGRVSCVVVMALEVGSQKSRDAAAPLSDLLRKLLEVEEGLSTCGERMARSVQVLSSDSVLFARSVKLMRSLIQETQALSQKVGSRAATAEPEVSAQVMPAGLSSRELEVVRLLAEGNHNKEIARILGISVRTVETHRAHIRTKVGVHSMGGLVRYAVRNGIVEA
jgi:DNA-binding CsgD family transcriptional regulator